MMVLTLDNGLHSGTLIWRIHCVCITPTPTDYHLEWGINKLIITAHIITQWLHLLWHITQIYGNITILLWRTPPGIYQNNNLQFYINDFGYRNWHVKYPFTDLSISTTVYILRSHVCVCHLGNQVTARRLIGTKSAQQAVLTDWSTGSTQTQFNGI